MTISIVFVSCSKFDEFSHATSILVEKHCPRHNFFRWLALRFREIMYAKIPQFSKWHLLFMQPLLFGVTKGFLCIFVSL